jgi:hypothetical protein
MNPAPTKSAPADPIDAVVTWVDGNDPAHRAKREAALKALGKSPDRSGVIPAGKDPTRFTDNGEIRWCLHSIRKFAPWIRHIHLVTDNQVPAFLTPEKQKELGVRIVDHTEIFRSYEWALPTFNTRSIETMIWRVEDLSERFIYFNDDFILLAPVSSAEFFRGNAVVCRGQWKRMRRIGGFNMLWMRVRNRILKSVFGITHTMHLLQQMRSARLAGFSDRYYRIAHVPHPLRKSTIENFFLSKPTTLESNITHSFRSTSQFSAVFLAYHLEINQQSADLVDFPDTTTFSGEFYSRTNANRLMAHLRETRTPFLCLQSLERFQLKDQKEVADHLMRITGA